MKTRQTPAGRRLAAIALSGLSAALQATAGIATAGLAAAGLVAERPAQAAERNVPTVTSLRLRMGVKGQIFLYPPTVPTPEGNLPVLFFSGDWGWKPIHQETASWLANQGRYVVGIESPEYFSRSLDPTDWKRDLRTLRTFVNEKAGRPPETPVLLIGSTWGAEMVPFMLNRGGAEGFAGALLIGPEDESNFIYRVTLQYKSKTVPLPPGEQFLVSNELRRLAPIPVVFMEGELDTESQARALADLPRGPKKYVSIPGGDKQFKHVRDIYFGMVGQALAWIETTAAPVHAPAPAAPGQQR